MATKYPTGIDDLNSLPKVVDLVSPIVADDHNRLRDAIVAMQTELGTNPSGTFGTLKERLDNFLAGDVFVADVDGYFAADNVEEALKELYSLIVDTFADLFADEVQITDADGYFVSTHVEGALAELGHEVYTVIPPQLGIIGDAEDGYYTDGLFKDFTSTTPVGTAIDRFNEVFAALAPPPAPDLGDIGFDSSIGVSGDLSFGASNTIGGFTNDPSRDVNGNFPTSASDAVEEKGIYGTGTSVKDGQLAESVAADTGVPNASYPANAFGDGYSGLLQLWVDVAGVATMIHQVDLTSFGSGDSTNGNGSGFIGLSAGTAVQFPSGVELPLFFYRTGAWRVATGDQQSGYNRMYVRHFDSGNFDRITNEFHWINDTDATATLYSGETMTGLSMLGSKFISGVEYHTSGSATYDITIDNAYRNTYSTGSAVTYGSSTNVSISSDSLPALPLAGGAEGTPFSPSKTATINQTRMINASITGRTTTARTRTSLSGTTSTGASISGILMDAQSDNSTNTDEQMNGEQFRVATNKALTDTSGYNSGGNDALWDQTEDLISGAAGHNDGLLMYNGILVYPSNTSGVASGDFSAVTNGPGGNPDYSSAAGDRYFWRYFYDSSTRQNFSLNVTSSGTTFVPVGSGLTATDVYLEVLAPNTTQDGGATIEFKDARVAYTTDNAIGCLNGTFSPTSWPMTLGGRSTATSGNAIVIRITAGAAWTGSITRMQLTWL